RGIPASGCRDWPQPALSADLLEAMAPAESIALHMMDRMDSGNSFSHEERRRHFHHLLRYWLGVIQRCKPDLIVFSIAPHIVYDYVLYALANHLGIQTAMFERIGLPGWVYPIRQIFDLPSTMHPHSQPRQVPLNPAFADYLRRSSLGGHTAVPPNFQKKLTRFKLDKNSNPGLLAGLWFETRRAAYTLKRYGLGPVTNTYIKLANRPLRQFPTAIDMTLVRLKGLLRKRRLKQRLVQFWQPVDLSRPYVFLALHYQPERATVPMGGMLGDQTLIVDIIAKALPPDWLLYVKEHPWQLQPFSRGEMQRNDAFYEQIASHANVRLVDPALTTPALIEQARAVATVTGSAGWQALCRGIPALIFGAAWYRSCPGAHCIRSVAEAKAAFATSRQPSADATEAFLRQVQSSCIPGTLEPAVEHVERPDISHFASSMTLALTDLVSNRRQSAHHD
ncbi:hypothetical protein, partial [Ferrovibrio sp.]|uniref:capsular polysaccharide export protein, LipB/KpsS family n=1 Tax=Ferrovibrio sp. TaxID=1917215 RepID=UPI0035B2456A